MRSHNSTIAGEYAGSARVPSPRRITALSIQPSWWCPCKCQRWLCLQSLPLPLVYFRSEHKTAAVMLQQTVFLNPRRKSVVTVVRKTWNNLWKPLIIIVIREKAASFLPKFFSSLSNTRKVRCGGFHVVIVASQIATTWIGTLTKGRLNEKFGKVEGRHWTVSYRVHHTHDVRTVHPQKILSKDRKSDGN